MKDNTVRALVIGILFMMVSVGALVMRQPPEKKRVDFSQATAEAETASTTESTTAAVKTTVSSISSSSTTNTTTKTTTVTTKAAVTTTAATEAATEFRMLDLNKATAEELCQLDGIGESKAAAIIAYREEHGGFGSIEEIMNVSGIGPETFEAIKAHIYVEVAAVTFPETTAAEVTETVTETVTATVIDMPEVTMMAAASGSATEQVLTLEDAAPINLNTADVEELMLLPHVDRSVAEKIIKFRSEMNGFTHPYQLLLIDELTQKEVAEILEFVTIGQ